MIHPDASVHTRALIHKQTVLLKPPSGLSLPSQGLFMRPLLSARRKNNVAASHKVTVMYP